MSVSVPIENHFDVVIVGSGLTGLTTAYNVLKRNVGLSVLILERHDEVGGRILRGTIGQAYYGSYCQKDIVKLLGELKISIYENRSNQQEEIDDEDDFSFLTRTPVSRFASAQVYHFFKLLNAMTTGSEFSHDQISNPDKGNLGKMSLNEFIKETVSPGRSRVLCASLLRAFCPGIDNLDLVSARWFLVMLSGAGGVFEKFAATLSKKKRFFVEGGFENVVDRLEEKIVSLGASIRRSEDVVKIESNERAIYVTTARGTDAQKRFKSECVVIAVPPPSNVGIETRLPKNFLDSQKLYEGGNNMFFRAVYERAFWTASSFAVEATQGNKLRAFYDASNLKEKSAVLAGFSSANNPEDIVSALREYLGRNRRLSECTSCETSRVAPVYFLRPCSLGLHANPMLTASSAERVHFAASEFASQWPGTADGAVEAGGRAARAILSRTRPQALGVNDVLGGPLYTPELKTRQSSNGWLNYGEAIKRAHTLCMGLNVCLLFLLLVDAY